MWIMWMWCSLSVWSATGSTVWPWTTEFDLCTNQPPPQAEMDLLNGSCDRLLANKYFFPSLITLSTILRCVIHFSLGYWGVWKGANKFALHTASDNWSTESSPPCNWDKNKHTQYPQVFSGQLQKLCSLKKMLRKSLPSFLDVLHANTLVSRLSHSFLVLPAVGFKALHTDVR